MFSNVLSSLMQEETPNIVDIHKIYAVLNFIFISFIRLN